LSPGDQALQSSIAPRRIVLRDVLGGSQHSGPANRVERYLMYSTE